MTTAERAKEIVDTRTHSCCTGDIIAEITAILDLLVEARAAVYGSKNPDHYPLLERIDKVLGER